MTRVVAQPVAGRETRPSAGLRVLVIDDDRAIRRILQTGLASTGYAVETASCASEGIERVRAGQPDVVLLDLGLPDMDGTEVIRQVRDWSRVPMIVLSAREDEAQKVVALESGADDYMTKPFGIAELVTRIRVALRHAGATDARAPVFRLGDLTIDFERRRVTVEQREVALTPTEYSLLKILAQHVGKVLTHTTLLREVWGPEYEAAAHYLHVYMARLRRKLEPDKTSQRFLRTESGAGYRLCLDERPVESWAVARSRG
jgi:two-component system KDP operon response regulator KdpE